MPNRFINACQNFDVNFVSQSIIYSSGHVQIKATFQYTTSTSCSTVYVSLYRKKYTYFVSRSTTIKILLYITPVALSFDIRSFVIKSIVIELQGLYAIGRGYSSLYSLYYPILLRLQILYFLTTSLTYTSIYRKSQCLWTYTIVFAMPLYPLSFDLQISLIASRYILALQIYTFLQYYSLLSFSSTLFSISSSLSRLGAD